MVNVMYCLYNRYMNSQFYQKHRDDIFYAAWTAIVVAVIAITAYALTGGGCVVADTVVLGNIYTGADGSSLTEAAAIKDSQFVYVGDRYGVEKHIGAQTKVLNYADGMVMAGMSDTHTHVTMDFMTAKDQISLSDGNTVEEYVAIIKNFISEHPDNEMYIGMGWQYDAFENETPTKEILDKISTDKPIYLRSSDAHSAWVNSAMFAKMGVTKDTPDPVGGQIKRDGNGELVGMMKETALGVYAKPLMPVYSVEEYKDFILGAQQYYASLGYTAYVEMFIDTDEANTNIYKAYEELDREDKLILRTQGAWVVNNNADAMNNVAKAIRLKDESQGGMFELTDVKFFMDGVVESGGAFMTEPYADDSTNYGLDRWPGDESFQRLVECIVESNKNGMVAHFHAMGDAATTKALDAIESARQQFVPKVHNVITHLEVVQDSDAARFKELDVVAAANLSWGSKVSEEHYNSVEVKRIGEERAVNAYPYKKLIDAGAVASYATDYPPGSSALPFGGFSVGISRSLLRLPETVRNEDLRLTREEALQALTANGAYQMRQDNMRGTIEVGKKADFIIIDTNLLTCLPGKAALTINLKTFVDGQEIFDYEES